MSFTLNSSSAEKLINQFDNEINAVWFLRDPFRSLLTQRTFDRSKGEVPTVLTYTGERPAGFPDGLSIMNTTDGPGASGDVPATEIRAGQKKRTYQIEVDAWRSQLINQNDVSWRNDPVGILRNVGEMLAEYYVARTADWNRIKNIEMLDNKVVIQDETSYELKDNSDTNFGETLFMTSGDVQAATSTTVTLESDASAVNDTYNTKIIILYNGVTYPNQNQGIDNGIYAVVSDYVGSTKIVTVPTLASTPTTDWKYVILDVAKLPTKTLEWAHLEQLYVDMERRGAFKFPLGYAGSLPTFALTSGHEIKQKLYRDDLAEPLNWFKPGMNFTARGLKSAVRGYFFNYDTFPIRYNEAMQKIYPFVNQDTTNGRESIANPDYRPVSLGGSAVYEVGYIHARETWECRPRPMDYTSLARANFKAQNYTGEMKWIVPPIVAAAGDNDLQNKGYFRVDNQKAARPMRPEMGMSLLYKIPSEV
jgi:hypothetical protein